VRRWGWCLGWVVPIRPDLKFLKLALLPAGFDLSIDMVALLVNLLISVLVPSVIGKVRSTQFLSA